MSLLWKTEGEISNEEEWNDADLGEEEREFHRAGAARQNDLLVILSEDLFVRRVSVMRDDKRVERA